MTAKEFLSSRRIRFEEKDIRADPESLRELIEDHNSRATPTLVIEGKTVIGFDLGEYEAALRLLET